MKIEKRVSDTAKVVEVHFDEKVPSRSIKVSEFKGFGSNNNGVEVNWSSLGAVSIEEAERFAEALQVAITEAKKL